MLRKLSPGQPAVGGTFTWFQHKKMDWGEDDNVSRCLSRVSSFSVAGAVYPD